MRITYAFFFAILFSLCATTASAWNNSIELGYGYSHDPNHTRYNNSGVMLDSDLYSFWLSSWTHWSFKGALGRWHSTAPSNQNLTTAALSIALRLYPFYIKNEYPAYVFGSAGPAYLSSRKFGLNTQGSHLSIQSNLGLGVEFNSIDVNLRFAHYSNAGLSKPNEGFNVLYLLSIGYLFN